MIKPEQVPMAVWKAALDEYYNAPGEEPLRRAIAAALNAWPGMYRLGNGVPGGTKPLRLILPLPQEMPNDRD